MRKRESVTNTPHPDEFDYYLCPISREFMRDPVSTPGGHSYERAIITAEIRRSGRDPMTGTPLQETDLRTERALQEAIAAHCRKNGITLLPVLMSDTAVPTTVARIPVAPPEQPEDREAAAPGGAVVVGNDEKICGMRRSTFSCSLLMTSVPIGVWLVLIGIGSDSSGSSSDQQHDSKGLGTGIAIAGVVIMSLGLYASFLIGCCELDLTIKKWLRNRQPLDQEQARPTQPAFLPLRREGALANEEQEPILTPYL